MTDYSELERLESALVEMGRGMAYAPTPDFLPSLLTGLEKAKGERPTKGGDRRVNRAYQVEGSLLEVCTCDIICPCWVGEDPDGGTCESALAWRIDKGEVNGLDVSGRILAALIHIPGNVLKGNWRAMIYVDDKTTPQQQQALLDVWTGKLGGAMADLAKLVGEVVGVERVPITFEVEGVQGTLKIGQAAEARLAPFQGAMGQPTALHDSIFSTIPGSPVYVGKASLFRSNQPALGHSFTIEGHSALQGFFRFEG